MATVKTLIGNIRGKQGEKGDRGDNGTSIVSVEQTTISSDDGGTNVITTTLSDGTQTTFNIKNGSKGEKGDSVIVDSELSSTSTNPVQNKVVNAALVGKLSTSGDSKSNTVTFTSNDVADGSAASWTSVTALASGITHATFFARVSQMFKNVRYLYKMLGTTDISSIGNGTVTNAISTLNSNLGGLGDVIENTLSYYSMTANTEHKLMSITLPKGKYVIIAQLGTINSDDLNLLHISKGGSKLKMTYYNNCLSFYYNATQDSTTLDLYASLKFDYTVVFNPQLDYLQAMSIGL